MSNATEINPNYPLARDADGNPINVPAEATAWRVRKLAAKAGRPKLLYDNDTGLPLEIPLTATVRHLADEVGEGGRFRLEAIDAAGRAIPNCIAVTAFALEEEEAPIQPQNMSEQLIAQLVASNTTMVQSLASCFAPIHVSAPQIETGSSPQLAPAVNLSGLGALSQVLGPLLAQIGVKLSAGGVPINLTGVHPGDAAPAPSKG